MEQFSLDSLQTNSNELMLKIFFEQDLLNRFETMVYNKWPRSEVYLFGSCATEMCLTISDLDFVVNGGSGYCKKPLFTLANTVRDYKMASKINLITNAKVPIIKMTDKKTNTEIDISFDMMSGPENSEVIEEFKKRYPHSFPLTIFLKYLLYQKGLNEPYSGGVGSYTLFSMVVSFLQMKDDFNASKVPTKYTVPQDVKRTEVVGLTQELSAKSNIIDLTDETSESKIIDPADKTSEKDASKIIDLTDETSGKDTLLGKLLIDFFEFYGTKFNFFLTGISLREGGSYFPKVERDWIDDRKPFKVAIEDPNDEGTSLSFFLNRENNALFN